MSTKKKSLEDLASRGDLVKDFVLSNYSSSEYIDEIDCLNYQGFNLILFDGIDGLICSNRGLEKKLIKGETYAIGNRPIEQKSQKIKNDFNIYFHGKFRRVFLFFELNPLNSKQRLCLDSKF